MMQKVKSFCMPFINIVPGINHQTPIFLGPRRSSYDASYSHISMYRHQSQYHLTSTIQIPFFLTEEFWNCGLHRQIPYSDWIDTEDANSILNVHVLRKHRIFKASEGLNLVIDLIVSCHPKSNRMSSWLSIKSISIQSMWVKIFNLHISPVTSCPSGCKSNTIVWSPSSVAWHFQRSPWVVMSN